MAEFPALLVGSDALSRGTNLNGRRWAGQALLEAWAGQLGDQPLDLACGDASLVEGQLKTMLESTGHSGPVRIHNLVDPTPYSQLGGLFIPDPSIGRWARWRQAIGAERFSLIGQIHTLNTPGALAHLEALASEPIRPWDALICTSRAGRTVVEAVLADREAQLQERFGTQRRLPRPQLPVIPLPIPAEGMQRTIPDQRSARSSLGIPANAHVCLWLGRLSMLTKLDPWPTYKLLERLAAALHQPVWLIECGPDDGAEQARHFTQLRQLCPNVRFLRLGGAEPVSEAVKFQALAAADVAVSLVDNCQETFGLSVVEAMAAGLPLVASDWDGYRDSIRHGVTGFLVASRWAAGSEACSFSMGWQQQLELLSFPFVAGALAQLVQLDIEGAYGHLLTLLSNPILARAMGQQGQQQAVSRYSNQAVMPRYQEMFEQLKEHRQEAIQTKQTPQPPLSLNPVRLFQHFASDSRPDKWAIPRSGSIPKVVSDNRQMFWNALMQPLNHEQRSALLQELHNKHL